MKLEFQNNRDVLAGLLFIALGAMGFVVALSYPFGSLQEMGPGFFPRVLGVVLIGFGLVTLFRGIRSGERVEGVWTFWPLLLLVVALVAFGWLIERLGLIPALVALVAFGWLMERAGLIPALVVLVVTSALAGKEFRWGETLVLTVVLCLLALAIFVWGLGLPYSLFLLDLGL